MEEGMKKNIQTKIKGHLSGFLRAGLVALLVLLQFAIIIILPYLVTKLTIYVYILMEILSVLVILRLINDNRSASYKISWICIVLIFPISGHIMYALWGTARTNHKMDQSVLAKIKHGNTFIEEDKEMLSEYVKTHERMGKMSKYLSAEHFPLTKNNQINYYKMGEEVFEQIFIDLANAKKFILIDFFIVAEGKLWDTIHEILLKKVKEGVEVKFLYDDFGAMIRTSKYFKKELEAEGIEVEVFNPIHKYTDKLYMNYRSHQKIIVIDGNIGYTGGINIADEYANIIKRFGVWKDNAVRVEGDGVWGLSVIFLQMWEVTANKKFLDYDLYKPTKQFKQNDIYCHVISDGPANNPNNPIENIYKQLIQSAGKYLYITTPYLIIEDDMVDTLITAVKCGIDVRIITPFIPDKKHVKILTNYNYGRLLEEGVRIFEYTPGFIHAKTIINEECGIVGTINMDYRSFYLHYECGLFMSHKETIKKIYDDLVNTMEQSKEITYEEWKNRPLWLKSYQHVLNVFSTLM